MRKLLLLSFVMVFSSLLLMGCLWRPLSGNENVTGNSTGSGCAFSSPPCGAGYACMNNSCVPRQGCDYNNPPCNSSRNETCVNNTCMAPVSSALSGCAYSNPACGADYDCLGNACVEKIICGKLGCQQGETQGNCCTDCGCPSGESCWAGNQCAAGGAHIVLENYSVSPVSATLLYAVPPKTIEKDRGPLVRLLFRNSGSLSAFNIKLKTEVPGYTGGTMNSILTIPAGGSLLFNITPIFNDKVIAITNLTTVNLVLSLDYYGGNQSYSDAFSAPIPVQGRDTADWSVPESVAAWINPGDTGVAAFALDSIDHTTSLSTDEQKERAARQIFGNLQARSVQYSDGGGTASNPGACYSDSLAFPAETLRERSGDCAGLAVLFDAALEATGMRSVVIETPSAVLAGYVRLDNSLAPIDLRNLDGITFADAAANGMAEYSRSPQSDIIIYPRDQWGFGMRKVDPGVAAPSSKISTLSANCYLTTGRFNVNYWFQNDGFDTGRRCVNATLYEGSSVYSSRRDCVDIALGDKRNITFVETGLPEDVTLTSKCFLD